VLRMLFAILRSRIMWIAVGVVTAAGIAFVLTVAVTWAVVIAVRGEDVDPDQVAELATSLGLLAAAAAIAAMLVAWRGLRRARVRRWLPLYEAMAHDAASATDTHLAQILTRPDPAAGGYVLAADLRNGSQGPLWLPGPTLPRGTVVSFTQTSAGPQVRAWMSSTLWRACAREAERVNSRTTDAVAQAERVRRHAEDRRIRHEADRVVAAAEEILKQHDRGLPPRHAARAAGRARDRGSACSAARVDGAAEQPVWRCGGPGRLRPGRVAGRLVGSIARPRARSRTDREGR